MTQLTTVIFDLGGVILNLDIPRYRSLMGKALGTSDLGDPFASKPPQFFYDLERGQITPEQFISAAKTHFGIHSSGKSEFSEEQFVQAFNSIIGTLPKERLDFLTELKKNYSLYLLSNTNALHQQAFEPMFTAIDPNKPIHSYFDDVFYSHELGERKPDLATYEAVLTKTGTVPEKTLFVDDLKDNIDHAAKLGIQGHHLTGDLLADKALASRLSVPSG